MSSLVSYCHIVPELEESVENIKQNIGHLSGQTNVGQEVLFIWIFYIMAAVGRRVRGQFVLEVLLQRTRQQMSTIVTDCHRSEITHFKSIDEHIPGHENSDSMENQNENDHIVPVIDHWWLI